MNARSLRNLALIALALVASCGPSSDGTAYPERDPDVPPITTGDWYRPTVATTWQWQLQIADGETALDTSYDVDVYDVDLFETDASTIAALQAMGRHVVCYVSAGSWETYRPDAGSFPQRAIGHTLDGWPDERWLDIRSPAVFDLVLARLDLAVAKGCDGVEPDNVDGYAQDTGFPLTYTHQIAWNRALANAAHERGLAVGLKNADDQVADLVDYYDFSLVEECHAYAECGDYAPFTAAGKPIWNAEYVTPDDVATATSLASTVCPSAVAANLRTLFLPLALDDAYRVSCD